MDKVADVGAAWHGGERRQCLPKALLLSLVRRRRLCRCRRGKQLVVDDVDFGLRRYRVFTLTGDNAAVRDAAPASVENAFEATGIERDRPARVADPALAHRQLDSLDTDPAGGLRSDRLEARGDLVVVRRVRSLNRDDAVRVLSEEKAAEGRVVALPRTGPPDDRLMHRASER